MTKIPQSELAGAFVPHATARYYLAGSIAIAASIMVLLAVDLIDAATFDPQRATPLAYAVSAVVAMAVLAGIIAVAYRSSKPALDTSDAQRRASLADPLAGMLAPFSKSDDDLEAALRREQGIHIFNQLALMMWFSGANSVAVALALWGTVNGVILALWLAASLAACALGLLAAHKAPALLAKRSISKRTLRRTTLHAGMRGLIWGLAFALFFADTGTTGRLILVCTACGMFAGGGPALAPVPSASLAYGLGIMVPTILTFLTMSGFDYALVAGLGITFTGSVVVIACQMYLNFAGGLIASRNEAEQSAVISLLLNEFETSASDWLWETNSNGTLIRFPDRMAKLLGLTSNRDNPLLPMALAGAHSNGRAEILRHMASGTPFRRIEICVKHPCGTLNWMALSASAKPEGGYRGVGSDITELKNQEAEIAAQSRRLTASNEELKQFATVASHDLQEPLRKIEAFGSRLKARTAGKLDDNSNMYLERMLVSTSRMRTLITDLLAYSRATRVSDDFTSVDLDTIVASVLDDLSVAIDEKKAIVSRSPLGSVHGNSTQLRQLFQNLVSNALKFSKSGETPTVTIARTQSQNGLAEFRIQDNGIGFDMVHRDKIFVIFQRLHGREAYEGTGVGLATCRKIAELHGGTINVESSPDHGSTFTITLPQILQDDVDLKSPAAAAA